MHSTDTNSKSGRACVLHQVLPYLMSELLLNLEAQREMLDHAVILRQPADSEGSTPIYAFPYIGMRWCAHVERTSIGPVTISSFEPVALANSVSSGGLTKRPFMTSFTSILATRSGVPRVL